ncbi:MAG TPA: 1-deoxy-D-xylulose-5-phosphate reductoisomerase [Bacteroidia bacterium]|jgi:1-deoxy-D-xylulose-5-phosphate reductoisomerase|nr:1-deoxy-D-xylulose-5-phosphate reductoisomerase [Bacteroidia bacterium]
MSLKKKKNIAILGSTGSIGTQALDVIKANPEHFCCEVLVANGNADLLIKQAIEFQPNAVVIADDNKHKQVKDALSSYDIKVFAGAKSVEQIVEMETVDIVLAAMVGFAGLPSTIHAIKNKKPIALANKETLVVAGELITKLAAENAVNIYPVDSEHSAVFQCLAGEFHNPIEKIYLTASGGPFRGKTKKDLQNITKQQALKHPNWSMGAKITIDSATLMNKGLEVIEAKWLFHVKPSQIEVVVHPQSIIHSLVQFTDGSIKAQLGLPDMKLPIHYAFSYPERVATTFERFDFTKYPAFTFEKPDTETFANLALAYKAIEHGGLMPCVLNAANEIAVDAFLHEKITFLQISELVETCLNKTTNKQKPSLEDYFNCNTETRKLAQSLIK